jgi:phenylalanine-4-hydroxylase
LSSFGELEFACSPDHPTGGGGLDKPPTYKAWDPDAASGQEFPITTYQPTYFVADTLMDAKVKM